MMHIIEGYPPQNSLNQLYPNFQWSDSKTRFYNPQLLSAEIALNINTIHNARYMMHIIEGYPPQSSLNQPYPNFQWTDSKIYIFVTLNYFLLKLH